MTAPMGGCIAGFRSGLGQRRVKSAGSNRGKRSYGSTAPCASCEMAFDAPPARAELQHIGLARIGQEVMATR
jgi:hypothetical protein